MSNTNYVGMIIKILDKPICQTIYKGHNVLRIRAQIPQKRKKQIVLLTFWGTLATDFFTKYKKDDYLLINGYISIPTETNRSERSGQVNITVIKAYPFVFSTLKLK